MVRRLSFAFAGALAAMAALTPAGAQAPATVPAQPAAAPSGPPSVVTYFEVAPAAARKAAGLLRQFSAASRKEDGNTEFLVLHQIGRPGHYAILETWRDKAALDAQGAAMKALGEKLQTSLSSAFEARQFVPLSVAAGPAGAPQTGAIYVLTHVDVFPAGKDQVAAMVKAEVDDSRKDEGVLRFDALVWDGHPNHFHLIEAWTGRAARDAHALAAHTKDFRAKVAPFEGAFYDERLYEAVR